MSLCNATYIEIIHNKNKHFGFLSKNLKRQKNPIQPNIVYLSYSTFLKTSVMKALNKALPGLCIGIGLIVMGGLLSHGIITVKDRDRIVTVKGLAEREVKADRVIWPLVFNEIGNDITSI